MSGFSYTCPKCRHSGNSTDFSCWNCDGSIERIEVAKNYEEIQCTRCGITQVPKCPSCGALVTFKMTEKFSLLGAIVGVVILFFVIKSCSGSDEPTKPTPSPATSSSNLSNAYTPPSTPSYNQQAEQKPKWIIKDD